MVLHSEGLTVRTGLMWWMLLYLARRAQLQWVRIACVVFFRSGLMSMLSWVLS